MHKVALVIVIIVVASSCGITNYPSRLHSQVQLKEEKEYNLYSTNCKCSVSFGKEEPALYSYHLKGRLPKGITSYGFAEGYSFKYDGRGEIIISPIVNQAETPEIPYKITLQDIELGTEYCSSYYYAISPCYTLWEKIWGRVVNRGFKEYPKNHVAYILRGDIASIYVITRKEYVIDFLSVIVSGCNTTNDFDLLWKDFIPLETH